MHAVLAWFIDAMLSLYFAREIRRLRHASAQHKTGDPVLCWMANGFAEDTQFAILQTPWIGPLALRRLERRPDDVGAILRRLS